MREKCKDSTMQIHIESMRDATFVPPVNAHRALTPMHDAESGEFSHRVLIGKSMRAAH
jgi:hypothetical protein